VNPDDVIAEYGADVFRTYEMFMGPFDQAISWNTQGMKGVKKFIDKSFDEIVEFAELGEFIDVPLKSFSSGMVARLGFAISTIVKPDILIVDEILSVGDFKFQEKSLNKIKSMMEDGVTVLMVSHSIDQIEKMCNRVVWLENGSIKKIGLTKEICNEYKNS